MKSALHLLCILLLTAFAIPLNAQIANDYPNDIGIEQDSRVLYVEKFDDGLMQILSRYSDISNSGGMTLDSDVPPGSLDPYSLRIACTPGQNTGGHLYRRFTPGFDSVVYVRYYVKYPSESKNFIHHEGIWFGGFNPSSLWPLPQAGTCGLGDKRLSIGFEPVWQNVDPHGMDTYLYWGDMRSWNDGSSCFGNTMITQGATEYNEPLITGEYPKITFDTWMCVEIMIKLNNPVSAYNGELAIWVNGEQVGHWGPGFPNGHWLKDKWYNNPADPAFEGFRWRTDSNLNINWLWILFFHSNPNAPATYIQYDHLVMANTYIGPLYNETSTISETKKSAQIQVLPNPGNGLYQIIVDNPNQIMGNGRIELFSLLGNRVYAEQIQAEVSSIEIDLSNYPDGIYIVKYHIGNEVFTSKLIKE